jgi:hypothetical protein
MATSTHFLTMAPKVSVAVEASDSLADPIVVSFPGGAPSDAQFVHRLVREGNKRGRKLVGKDATCLYQAESQGKGYDGRRTKLCIGLYNKKTGKLTVHLAAEKGTVFALEQSIPKYIPVAAELRTAAQRRKALFQDFGSTKKIKILKSQEANRVTVDSAIGTGSLMAGAFQSQTKMSASNRKAMEESKRGEKVSLRTQSRGAFIFNMRIVQVCLCKYSYLTQNYSKQSDAVELAYAEARLAFLPAFDVDAKEAYMIYSARDIAGDEAWGRISRLADACLHQGPTKFLAALTERGTWHDCTTTILQSIPLDSPHAKFQVKTAILMNHLITFHLQQRALKGDVKIISRSLEIPPEVCQRFLDLFSTAVGSGRDARYATSKPNKDKCRVHLLLLFLMAQGGRTMKVGSVKPICEILKMDTAESANLLREAGCTVKGASTALTVPLTFPQAKRGGRGN